MPPVEVIVEAEIVPGNGIGHHSECVQCRGVAARVFV